MSRLLLTAMLLFSVTLYGQTTESHHAKPVTGSDEKYLSQIQEIYGADRMAADEELVKQLLILLKERVHFVYQADMPEGKYELISSLPLHNKNNSQITAVDPSTFSPDTFNPLTYNWNYFSDRYLTFRIDGTNYLLIVDPQTIKNQ